MDLDYFTNENSFTLPYLYDLFYDEENHGISDLNFYLSELEKLGNDILEIGCGTGRVLIPLAKNGKNIDGIDPDKLRISFLKHKIKDFPREIISNIHVYETDLMNYETNKLYDAVIFPFRCFQHFYTDQERCDALEYSKKFLKKNGKIILDVYFTDISLISNCEKQLCLYSEKNDQLNNIHIEKLYYKDQINYNDMWFQGYWKYNVYLDGSLINECLEEFKMAFYNLHQLRDLFVKCGFKVIAEYGDFNRNIIETNSSELIFILEKEGF